MLININFFFWVPIKLLKESTYNRMHPSEATSPAAGQRLPGYMDYQGMGVRAQCGFERKWALGLQVCLCFTAERCDF